MQILNIYIINSFTGWKLSIFIVMYYSVWRVNLCIYSPESLHFKLHGMLRLQNLMNDLLCRPCWLNVRDECRRQEFMFLQCFYSWIAFFFKVRETIMRSRNLFIVNFGEDTRNCINVTFIVSLKSKWYIYLQFLYVEFIYSHSLNYSFSEFSNSSVYRVNISLWNCM